MIYIFFLVVCMLMIAVSVMSCNNEQMEGTVGHLVWPLEWSSVAQRHEFVENNTGYEEIL